MKWFALYTYPSFTMMDSVVFTKKGNEIDERSNLKIIYPFRDDKLSPNHYLFSDSGKRSVRKLYNDDLSKGEIKYLEKK